VSERGPAKSPCPTCPYRKDVPSGVWHESEYGKLPEYDGPTFEQPVGAFFCHQQNGRLCAGWCGTHDMGESLGLRFAASTGVLSTEDVEAALDYVSPVPLFASGEAAAMHGIAQLDNPSPEARAFMQKIERRRARAGK
jgi:hypothetical protein